MVSNTRLQRKLRKQAKRAAIRRRIRDTEVNYNSTDDVSEDSFVQLEFKPRKRVKKGGDLPPSHGVEERNPYQPIPITAGNTLLSPTLTQIVANHYPSLVQNTVIQGVTYADACGERDDASSRCHEGTEDLPTSVGKTVQNLHTEQNATGSMTIDHEIGTDYDQGSSSDSSGPATERSKAKIVSNQIVAPTKKNDPKINVSKTQQKSPKSSVPYLKKNFKGKMPNTTGNPGNCGALDSQRPGGSSLHTVKPIALTELTESSLAKFLRDTKHLAKDDFSRLIASDVYEELNGIYGDSVFDAEGQNMAQMRVSLEAHRKMLEKMGPGISSSIKELSLLTHKGTYLE